MQAVFTEEVAARGGNVIDTFDDGRRLFLRSVLPLVEEVRPKDKVQGGVALKATEREVWLHPYVFRQVCRNGAIMAEAIQTRHLADVNLRDADEAESLLREAVEVCCAAEAFTTAAGQMRSALEVEADLELNVLSMLSRFARTHELVAQILDQFFREGDRSRFGLMNAVTAVARDTRDPQLRWDLEELGGGIPVARHPKPPRSHAAAKPAERREAALVG
jgi:hypothetical protein